MKHARGFTLIEVLLATVLLAAGLALAFATLRAAGATVNRGEATAQRNEHLRAVEQFLRARLTGTRAIGFALNGDTGLAERFLGERARMKWVADLPDYLGRGGPYVHELTVDRDGEDLRLMLGLTMVLAGQEVAEQPPRPPEVLADHLRSVRFRYRAMQSDNRPGGWQEQWEQTEALPMQVEITLQDADGRAWPTLVVALPLAGSYAPVPGDIQ